MENEIIFNRNFGHILLMQILWQQIIQDIPS